MKKKTVRPFAITLTASMLLLLSLCYTQSFRVGAAHAAASPTLPANMTVFAPGLNNPRGLKFGPDGNLYVAEGGVGGTNSTIGQCEQVKFPVGPYTGDTTGSRISRIDSQGNRTTVVDNLPSSQTG